MISLKHSYARRTPALTLLLTAGLMGPHLAAQSLVDFGYQRLTANGTPATGARPVAVILMQYDSAPAANIAKAAPLAHDASYYYHFMFDFTQRSVNGHYMENSHGLFHLVPAGAGVYGPFAADGAQWDLDASDGSSHRLTYALQMLAGAGFNFADYDYNGDGIVDQSEITIVVIDNIGGANAGNRPANPYCFAPPNQNVQVCLPLVGVGHVVGLMSMAHELSEQFGTIDLYGASHNENVAYTPMCATITTADDQSTFHFDPWHKMLLGWVQPTIYSLDSDGSAIIKAPQLTDGNPIILYSPAKGPLEYYMLEFRTSVRPGGAGYDANVNDPNWHAGSKVRAGLVVWHVATQGKGGDLASDVYTIDAYDQAGAVMNSVFMNGAPNFNRGIGDMWAPGTTTGSLTWLNGLGRQVKVKVGKIVNNGDAIEVSWGLFPDPPQPFSFLFNNSTANLGAAGYVHPIDATFTTQQAFPMYDSWTSVATAPSDVFLYNSHTGHAVWGVVQKSGAFQTLQDFGHTFSAGWTHVLYHKAYLFFYNANSGAAAVGQIQGGVFHQYNTWYGFSKGWTSIVSTPNGLVFYNANNGSGAVGDWNVISSGSGFGVVSRVDFNQLSSFAAGTLSAGWTHIVNTSNGVLFYNASNGIEVMTDVLSNGGISTRSNAVATTRPGWTSIASDGYNLLFYDAATGDVAVGDIRASRPDVNTPNQVPLGGLEYRRWLPSYFSTGWTQVVPVSEVSPI